MPNLTFEFLSAATKEPSVATSTVPSEDGNGTLLKLLDG